MLPTPTYTYLYYIQITQKKEQILSKSVSAGSLAITVSAKVTTAPAYSLPVTWQFGVCPSSFTMKWFSNQPA